MCYSPGEWHWISALPVAEFLPVVADVAREWQRYLVDEGIGTTNQIVDPEAKLLVISPHPDDAALSVGGLLLRAAAKGWQRHIGTLFGRSDYQLSHVTEGSSVEDISARRTAEDQHFAGLVGATLHQGNALDAPLRHPSLSPFRQPDNSEVAEFEAMVDTLVLNVRPRLLLGPAGIGGHVGCPACRDLHGD